MKPPRARKPRDKKLKDHSVNLTMLLHDGLPRVYLGNDLGFYFYEKEVHALAAWLTKASQYLRSKKK